MKLLPFTLAAAILLIGTISGCGKRDEETPRFNKQLGSGVNGLPIAGPSVNTGLLTDPAAYKPINPPQPAGASGAGGGAGDAFVTEDVQAAIKGIFTAGLNYDADKLLGSINPARIAAMTSDHRSAVIDFFTTLKNFWSVVEAKTKDQQDAKMAALAKTFPTRFIDAFAQSLDVKLLADDTAVATLVPDKFVTNIEPLIRDAMAAMPAGAGGVPGAPPGSATSADDVMKQLQTSNNIPPIPLTFKKVDGAWKLDTGYTLAEEDAELIAEGFTIGRALIAALTDKVDAASPFDEKMMPAYAMESVGSVMGDFSAWWLKVQARLTELMSGGAMSKPASQPTEAAPATAPAPPEEGGGRRRRPGGP